FWRQHLRQPRFEVGHPACVGGPPAAVKPGRVRARGHRRIGNRLPGEREWRSAHAPVPGLVESMSGTDMPDPTADPVVDALLRANRALVAITARSLSAVNADVTLAQFRSLVVLATAGPQTVSALADRLAVHASTMTRMCNRLVARGLVVRAPSAVDRREVVIALTSMGTSVVEKVMTARRKELDEVMRRMGEDDRTAVVVALDKFAGAAGVTPTSSSDTQLSVAEAVRQILEES